MSVTYHYAIILLSQWYRSGEATLVLLGGEVLLCPHSQNVGGLGNISEAGKLDSHEA